MDESREKTERLALEPKSSPESENRKTERLSPYDGRDAASKHGAKFYPCGELLSKEDRRDPETAGHSLREPKSEKEGHTGSEQGSSMVQENERSSASERVCPAEQLMRHEREGAGKEASPQFGPDGFALGEMKSLPPDGTRVWFHEDGRAWRGVEGQEVVEVRLRSSIERQGFENVLPNAKDVGREGQDRCHLIGPGFGVESPYGMTYAHQEVNRLYQNHGIEAYIRDIGKEVDSQTDVYVKAEVFTQQGSREMKEVHYEVSALRHDNGEAPRTLFDQYKEGVLSENGRDDRSLLLLVTVEPRPGGKEKAKCSVDFARGEYIGS